MHDSQDFEVPTEAQVEIASNAFRLLADPTRIKLLRALRQGESSVSSLADLVAALAHSGVPAPFQAALGQARASSGRHLRLLLGSNDHVAQLLAEALFHADHQVLGLSDHPAGRRRLRHDAAEVMRRGLVETARLVPSTVASGGGHELSLGA